FALNNCSECMFSFNLRNAKYAIGNAILPKDKYLEIKSSLLEQMRAELQGKKSLPSLTDIISKSKDSSKEAKKILAGKLSTAIGESKSTEPMEKAFTTTCKVLFGVGLSGLEAYKPWLTGRMPQGEKRKSVFSGREIYVGNYAKYMEIPKNRTVLEDEALKYVEVAPPVPGIESITLSNAHEFISAIAYMSLDYHDGTNTNVIDCMAYAYSTNAIECAPCVQIKDSAYNFWPRTSEHAFGCGVLFDSSFCIHCYQSVKLTRCFEVDSSRDCADLYFCHNCENVHDSMFCFNVKNMKYAIGNVEVGREKYLELKASLLARIAPELALKKSLATGIYGHDGKSK
ncbi:MAG TPA: hypothetical protein PLO51_01310, partial [Candidatus Micrarchaeota archaeon]|nr:hypothetical protein [Candidatus Micrarchaeota archaeon]